MVRQNKPSSPAKEGIQYAAAARMSTDASLYWIARSSKPGDDNLSRFRRHTLVAAASSDPGQPHGLRGSRTQNIENNPMQSSPAVAGMRDPAKSF